MDRDYIQDSTRYVVKSLHRGSIIPGNRIEMSRNVYLEPGAEIIGGIWADQLHIINGEVEIHKSVFVRKSLFIGKCDPGTPPITMNSCCVVGDDVVQNGQFPLLRFRSDLYSSRVNLKNAIIYGSIYADQIMLDHCIVLGGVYCKGRMEIRNSIVFTFRANVAVLNENVSLLSPFGLSDSMIQIKAPVNVLSLNDLFKGEEPSVKGVLTLDETDIYFYRTGVEVKNKAVMTDLLKEDCSEIGSMENAMCVLSMAGRVIEANEIAKGFRANKNLIQFLTLHSHLSDAEKKSLTSEDLESIEAKMYALIEEKAPFPKLESTYSFNELFKKYKGE